MSGNRYLTIIQFRTNFKISRVCRGFDYEAKMLFIKENLAEEIQLFLTSLIFINF